MRIEGRWVQDQDGIERPVLDGYLVLPDGHQIALSFLIDTGADSTVLAPTFVAYLPEHLQPTATGATASGIGGTLPLYQVAADLLLPTSDGKRARIHGPLPLLLTPGALERSVIGRDVLDQFTLLYARPVGMLFPLTPPDQVVLL